MWFRDWRDISWFEGGTPSQRRAMRALHATAALQHLAPFDPVLAGTIPIDVDVDGSDLDVICYVPDAMHFATVLTDAFSRHQGFVLRRGVIRGDHTTIASFTSAECTLEIFGQDVPVDLQAAVVHLDVEARLLAMAGPQARHTIRALKRKGLKTEPAFATWLALAGDPYEALYALASKPDHVLQALIQSACADD